MGILFALAGLIIPIVHMRQLMKGRRGLGRYSHTLSMGACCLAIWKMMCSYGQRVAHHDWSGLEDTYEAVNSMAMGLLIFTLLLNLALAYAEGAMDAELKEDRDLTI